MTKERQGADLRQAMMLLRGRIVELKEQIRTVQRDAAGAQQIADLLHPTSVQSHFQNKAREASDKLKFATGLEHDLRVHVQALGELERTYTELYRSMDAVLPQPS